MDRVLILYTPTKFLIQCPQYAPINVTEDRLKVSPLPSFFLNGPRTLILSPYAIISRPLMRPQSYAGLAPVHPSSTPSPLGAQRS